jgi:hypothetical protein
VLGNGGYEGVHWGQINRLPGGGFP